MHNRTGWRELAALLAFTFTLCEIGWAAQCTMGASEQQRMLDRHNYYRSQSSLIVLASKELGPLVWDANLASSAQSYADYCVSCCKAPVPSPEVNRKDVQSSCRAATKWSLVGENYVLLDGNDSMSAVDRWVNGFPPSRPSEKYSYNIYTHSCSSEYGCENYMQIVWNETRYVGCGCRSCDQGESTFWVCQYGQRATYERPPYQYCTSLSQCKSDPADEAKCTAAAAPPDGMSILGVSLGTGSGMLLCIVLIAGVVGVGRMGMFRSLTQKDVAKEMEEPGEPDETHESEGYYAAGPQAAPAHYYASPHPSEHPNYHSLRSPVQLRSPFKSAHPTYQLEFSPQRVRREY